MTTELMPVNLSRSGAEWAAFSISAAMADQTGRFDADAMSTLRPDSARDVNIALGSMPLVEVVA